jgi:hypothetical protein
MTPVSCSILCALIHTHERVHRVTGVRKHGERPLLPPQPSLITAVPNPAQCYTLVTLASGTQRSSQNPVHAKQLEKSTAALRNYQPAFPKLTFYGSKSVESIEVSFLAGVIARTSKSECAPVATTAPGAVSLGAACSKSITAQSGSFAFCRLLVVSWPSRNVVPLFTSTYFPDANGDG